MQEIIERAVAFLIFMFLTWVGAVLFLLGDQMTSTFVLAKATQAILWAGGIILFLWFLYLTVMSLILGPRNLVRYTKYEAEVDKLLDCLKRKKES